MTLCSQWSLKTRGETSDCYLVLKYPCFWKRLADFNNTCSKVSGTVAYCWHLAVFSVCFLKYFLYIIEYCSTCRFCLWILINSQVLFMDSVSYLTFSVLIVYFYVLCTMGLIFCLQPFVAIVECVFRPTHYCFNVLMLMSWQYYFVQTTSRW